MDKIRKFLSLVTDEKRYSKFVIRAMIEVIIFGGLLAITDFLIPPQTALRLICVFFLFAAIISLFNCMVRCINVSDNREKEKVFANKYKEKFKPIPISKTDLIFWLKNANLFEAIVVKSPLKYSIIEVSVEKQIISIFRDNKLYESIDILMDLLEQEFFIVDDKIMVCETFDHNSPEVLVKIIEALKEKNR